MVCWTLSTATQGQTIDEAFFESRIRPVLVQRCYECHNSAEQADGSLALDYRGGLLEGGDAGPAIVPGAADKSLLIEAIRFDGELRMPEGGPKLDQTIVNDFIAWIDGGAPDPRDEPPSADELAADLSWEAVRGRRLAAWQFSPPEQQPAPVVHAATFGSPPTDPNGLGTIDRWIGAGLEQHGLVMADEADRQTLIRRLALVLTGLPPTLDELERFTGGDRVSLDSDDWTRTTYVEAVDHYLASPAYGERWARHWMDWMRYADSHGSEGDPAIPHAYRYRDYLIRAINEDLPLDQMVREQLAGDQLAAPRINPDTGWNESLLGLGHLRMVQHGFAPVDPADERMRFTDNQIDVVSKAFLGLTVSCARCHDHKFDPIPTRDYYALAGIFTSTETMWGTAAHEGLTAPATDLHVLKSAPQVPPPADFVETVLVLESNTGKPKPIPKSKWAAGTPLAMGVRDRDKPADAKINIKGESSKTGDAVPRGFLSACDLPVAIEVDASQSGRRQLAEWITHSAHPLTGRVIVNRVWQQMFGEGIVRTPDDFGVYGERPTHPELLDHLATQFMQDGWSIKRLVRAIALSHTYRLTSAATEKQLEIDQPNRLLARHDRRRLEAEALRDRMLHASGQLDLQPGDGSLVRHRDILVNLAGNLHEPSPKRSVYLCYLRSSPPPELAAFDLPDFTSVLGKRDVSTVPGQALHLFNSPFVVEQAGHFARWVMEETADPPGRARLAWQRAFGRDPSPQEVDDAVEFVLSSESELESPEQAWSSFCQALLIANEFRYVD
ncbi:MAG: PSD1 domain-containing protein [Planctomycetales bacterium]|nr:PSD1 domain-containing protein [Planctomycetales bacterium]